MSANLCEPNERQVPRSPNGRSTSFALPDLPRRFAIARTGLLSVVDQAVVSGTSFATAAIIARACSQDQLGLYYLTLSIVLVLVGIQEQVITAPYTIYCHAHSGRALAEYAGSTWVHYFALTVVGWLALLATSVILSLTGGVDMVPGLWALVGVGPLLLLREAIRRFGFAHMQFSVALAVDIAVAAAQLGSLLVLANLKLLSVPTIFGVMGGACGLACCGWFVLRRPKLRLVGRRIVPDWLRNWSFAKWALLSFLVGNTTPLIMTWVVTAIAGTAATGVLGACTALVGVVNVFVLGVGNVLTPRTAQAVAHGGVGELRRVLMGTIVLLIVVLGASFVAMLLAGGWVAETIYGQQFHGCGPILAALALGLVAAGTGMTTGTGLWALGKPRANLVPDCCGIVVAVLSAIILVHPYGALGAALATLAGALVAATVRALVLRRAMREFSLQPVAA
jgi:O-antigen/teichoic acid export membrane protein